MQQAILMTQIAESAGLEHRYLASLARQALVAEAQLTPKPGLVDRRGSGSHRDLSLEIMIRSAAAIEPFFLHMAAACASARVDAALRAVLAAIGREAESAMSNATGGTNSHKGAIWILGLLIAGASSNQDTAPARVAEVAGSIARIPDRARLQLVSHGASSLRSSWRSRRGLRGFSSRDRCWIARSDFGPKPRSVRRNEPAHGSAAHHGFPRGHLRSLPLGFGRVGVGATRGSRRTRSGRTGNLAGECCIESARSRIVRTAALAWRKRGSSRRHALSGCARR